MIKTFLHQVTLDEADAILAEFGSAEDDLKKEEEDEESGGGQTSSTAMETETSYFYSTSNRKNSDGDSEMPGPEFTVPESKK